MSIDSSFKIGKMTNLSQLIKTKNGGASGRKKRGHKSNAINSKKSSVISSKEVKIDKSQSQKRKQDIRMSSTESNSESDCDEIDKFYYIHKLIKPEFRTKFDKLRSSKKKTFTEEMVQEDFESLNDNFLEFDHSDIKKYFEKNAWSLVEKIIAEKQNHSRCSISNLFCYQSCICCSMCSYWYHCECAGISTYFKKSI